MNMIPHNKLSFDTAETEAAARVVASGYWAGGPEVMALEQELCAFFTVKHAICVASGVAALRLALLSQNQKGGGHCALPSYSCVALPNAALAVGKEPVPVDTESDDYTINLEGINPAPDMDCAITVNTFGALAPIPARAQRSFNIIEDCSHGFFYDYEFKCAKIRGDLAITSFYATKLIGGGEGGVILTNDQSAADFARDWRDYTDKAPEKTRLNDKMTDIQAAIIRCQLQKLPAFLEKRKALAQDYNDAFQNLKSFTLPSQNESRVWYRYVLSKVCDENLDIVIETLKTAGISVCRPVELWAQGAQSAGAKKAADCALSIPLYPSLTNDQQHHIINTIRTLDEQLAD